MLLHANAHALAPPWLPQTVYAEQCRAALMDITQRVISREH